MFINKLPDFPLYVENAYLNGSWKYYTDAAHCHGLLECCYIVDGSCTLEVEESTFSLSPKNLVLFNSSLPHKISVKPEASCTILGFSLSPDTAPGSAAFPTLLTVLNTSLDVCRMLLSLKQALVFPDAHSLYDDILRLLGEFESRKDAFYLTSLAYHLLSAISRLPLTEKSAVPYYVEKAENYIRESFYQIKNNEQIAAHIGLNPTYLERIYKKATKTSLWEAVTLCRLAAARELLKQSPLPISEVERRVGFANRQTFYLQFKKRYGMSPSEYRKQAGKLS